MTYYLPVLRSDHTQATPSLSGRSNYNNSRAKTSFYSYASRVVASVDKNSVRIDRLYRWIDGSTDKTRKTNIKKRHRRREARRNKRDQAETHDVAREEKKTKEPVRKTKQQQTWCSDTVVVELRKGRGPTQASKLASKAKQAEEASNASKASRANQQAEQAKQAQQSKAKQSKTSSPSPPPSPPRTFYSTSTT